MQQCLNKFKFESKQCLTKFESNVFFKNAQLSRALKLIIIVLMKDLYEIL